MSSPANGDTGMRVELDRVLLRDDTLTPEEILMSESQERMMAIVRPDLLDDFLAVTAKWEVDTSVLGEVTGDGRLVITWHGETIVDVDPKTVAIDSPVYERPMIRPTWLDPLQNDSIHEVSRDNSVAGVVDQIRSVLSHPEPASCHLDYQPVRPLRAGQHCNGRPRRRWHAPGR